MAELIAQLDGPIYVERVALFDAKQRVRAQKAIQKAIRLQVENKGFAFVEVLSECPLHLGKTPLEAERWVKEKMVPVFPLGVKKDVARDDWPEWKRPSFEAERLMETIGGSAEPVPRYGKGFPAKLFGRDIGLKLAGAGGDGAQTAAMLIARAAINEGFDASHIPSYGPESRGGTSYADVHLSETEVLSPAAPDPQILIAFNAPSLEKFAPRVVAGGLILYDSSVITAAPELDPRVRALGVPFTAIAQELGNPMIKNIAALGGLQGATALFPPETFLTAVRHALSEKRTLAAVNELAFARGRGAALHESERTTR
jgi:2-oxoisovalerate ferredoxin oxidoreductase beta subunit